MMKLSPETLELINKATVHATYTESVVFGLWDIFYPQKRDIVVEKLKQGMGWKYAFEEAKLRKLK